MDQTQAKKTAEGQAQKDKPTQVEQSPAFHFWDTVSRMQDFGHAARAGQTEPNQLALHGFPDEHQLLQTLNGVANGAKEGDFTFPKNSSTLSDSIKKGLGIATTQETPTVIEDLFKRLAHDPAKLDYIELSKGVQDPTMTGKSAQVIAGLFREYPLGFNRDQMSEFRKSRDAVNYQDTIETVNDLASNLSIKEFYPRNSQGVVDRETMRKAVDSEVLQEHPSDSAYDKSAKAAQRNEFLLGINAYDTLTALGSLPGKPEIGLTDAAINRILLRTENYQSLAKKAHEFDSIAGRVGDGQVFDKQKLLPVSMESIQQGSSSTCYFDAAVASVANAHPASAQKWIEDNHDGTVTVTAPGGDGPTRVAKPSEAELGLYNLDAGAASLEKAYAVYLTKHPDADIEGLQQKLQKRKVDLSALPPIEKVGAGENLDYGFGKALKFLTGKNPDNYQLEHGSEAVHKAMLDASANERATIAAAQNSTGSGYHVYSVLKVTPDGTDGGTVTLRDPYGSDSRTKGAKDGVFTMPWQEFSKKFSYVAIEGQDS